MEQSKQKIKYFKYSRKSTESEDRQVLSLNSQDSELTKIAQREKLDVIALPGESKSAKAPYNRPVFDKMLDRIEKGEGNGIIVWHPDRLSRNSVDTGRIIYLMDIGKLLEVRTPTNIFRNTPNDKFLFSILCGAAKLENDNKGINVKRGLHMKAEMGWYPTVAPVGYLNDTPNQKGQREIKIDPERFELVRKMFDLMLTGTHTPPQILKIATNKWCFRMRNGKPMARSTLYRIFTDSFYYGMYEYPKGSGNWYKGKHLPMITIEEYDRIQILLGRQGKPRPQSHFFTFSGMIRCGECGSTITADEKVQVICSKCKFKFSAKHVKVCPKCNTPIEEMKKPVILRYVYYRCSHGKKSDCTQKHWIREGVLENQIIDILGRIEIPEEFHNWAMKHLRSENREEASGKNQILSNVKKQYTECLKKIDGLIEMRANGELTEEEFARKKESLTKDKFRLQELSNDTDNRVDKWLDAAERVFTFARDAKTSFETGDMETKRQILETLGSNLTLNDKSLTVKIEKPLILVEKISSAVKSIFDAFEPNKNPKELGSFDTIFAQNPEILRR